MKKESLQIEQQVKALKKSEELLKKMHKQFKYKNKVNAIKELRGDDQDHLIWKIFKLHIWWKIF
jgi:hypothetical protein